MAPDHFLVAQKERNSALVAVALAIVRHFLRPIEETPSSWSVISTYLRDRATRNLEEEPQSCWLDTLPLDMASITKLSLRGVRAFSPDDEDQVIEFNGPVTVIVGSNGTGKTTIIESLKYAVTGSLPPGKNSGQAFVHDPRSVGQTSVKANIKLRFNNRAGNSMVVIRSMEVTQKKSTMSFKALDGILRTHDTTTGERVSMSHKCTELDRQIPTMLGVSKAVLENVVFCHQEDSSWPLQEGAELKKKFDAIFDSTRYAKALDAIRKSKKEYHDIAKDLKGELNGLASHQHAAKGFRKELSEHVASLEELEQDVEDCNNGIKEADAEIKRTTAIAFQVEDLKSDLEVQGQNLDRELAVLDTQRNTMEKDLTSKHSVRELKSMLRDFESSRQHQQDEKETLEDQCQAYKKELEAMRNEKNEINTQQAVLANQQQQHEKLLKERVEKMEEMASEYNMELTGISQTQAAASAWTGGGTQSTIGSETVMGGATQDTQGSLFKEISQDDVEAFDRGLDRKEADFKDNLAQQRKQSTRQNDDLQSTLSDLNAKLKAIEHDKQKGKDEIEQIRTDLNGMQTQSSSIGRVRKRDVDEAKERADKFAKELEEANKDPELKEIPIKIRSLDGKIDSLKRDIEAEEAALTTLRDHSEAQNEIVILKKQAVKDTQILQEQVVQDHSYVLQRFNVQVPNPLPGTDGEDQSGEQLTGVMESVAETIRDKFETALEKLNEAKENMSKSQQVVSEKSALVSHNRSHLMSIRQKLNSFSGENGAVKKFERIVAAIKQFEAGRGIVTNMDARDPQKVLSYLGTKIEEIEASASDTVPPEMMTKVIDMLQQLATFRDDDGNILDLKCPCCRKEIEGPSEAKQFKESLKNLKSPEGPLLAMADRSKADQAAKSNYERWKKAVSESLQDLLEHARLEKESKEIESALKDQETELSAQESERDELKANSAELQNEMNELRELSDTAKRWCEDASKIAGKKSQVSVKQADLSIRTSGAGGDRDLKTVERDLRAKQAEKDNHLESISKLNKQQAGIMERIGRINTQVKKSADLAKEKERKFEEGQQMENQKKKMNARLKELHAQEQQLSDQITPLKQKVRTKEKEKERMRNEATAEETRLSDILNKFVGEMNEIRRLNAQINEYTASDKPGELDKLKEQLEALADRSKEKMQAFKDLQPELDRITKNIEDQSRQKKIIEANIELIDASKRVGDLEKTIAALKEDIVQVEGQDTCEEEQRAAQRRKDELLSNKARHEGRRLGYVDQIRTLKRKLKSPEYAGIDERHRETQIKFTTTEEAVRDMQKYHDALDKALLKFHGIKIAEINKIIRELWTMTYKGQDITNIQLVSGQDSGTKSKRSYDYRVVMTKQGGQKLDMRGRCSAGQRVLACIVIRLALAETFCVQCGCMTLDEPTTNLDAANLRSLAVSLAQIIASRSQQRNFQLIVITHDEEFVSAMKSEFAAHTGFDMPERYFQIRREESADGKYYSKIDSISWDELL